MAVETAEEGTEGKEQRVKGTLSRIISRTSCHNGLVAARFIALCTIARDPEEYLTNKYEICIIEKSLGILPEERNPSEKKSST